MSSKNNLNPDHYKVGGRDRQGETIAATPKPHLEEHRSAPPHSEGEPNFIPGAAPVGVSPEKPAPSRADTKTAQTSGGKSGVRSSGKKQATANRGGKAPGKARPVAGAYGKERTGPKQASARRRSPKPPAKAQSRRRRQSRVRKGRGRRAA